MLQINGHADLTDQFILEINDNLFVTTVAYSSFGTKQMFVNKIHDTQVRYTMLKNILQLCN